MAGREGEGEASRFSDFVMSLAVEEIQRKDLQSKTENRLHEILEQKIQAMNDEINTKEEVLSTLKLNHDTLSLSQPSIKELTIKSNATNQKINLLSAEMNSLKTEIDSIARTAHNLENESMIVQDEIAKMREENLQLEQKIQS